MIDEPELTTQKFNRSGPVGLHRFWQNSLLELVPQATGAGGGEDSLSVIECLGVLGDSDCRDSALESKSECQRDEEKYQGETDNKCQKPAKPANLNSQSSCHEENAQAGKNQRQNVEDTRNSEGHPISETEVKQGSKKPWFRCSYWGESARRLLI